MSFRDDHDAVIARADALQRERDDLAEKLARTEGERDAATREQERLEKDNARLHSIADPSARQRDRKRSAVIGMIAGGILMFFATRIHRCATAPRSARPRADAPAVAPPADATVDAPRDIGTPPLRVDQINAVRFWPHGGFSIRSHYTVTRLRELPEGTEVLAKLTCEVGTERRVAVDPLGIPGPPIAIGEGAATYVDQFMWAPIEPDPSRCEALVYVQMPGASPSVIDHEAGRFCLTITGPAKAQTVTPTRGRCQ